MIKTNYGEKEQMVREAIEKTDTKNIGFALKAFEYSLQGQKVSNIVSEIKERCDREGSNKNLSLYLAYRLANDCGIIADIRTGNKDLDARQKAMLRKILLSNLTVELTD